MPPSVADDAVLERFRRSDGIPFLPDSLSTSASLASRGELAIPKSVPPT